MKSFLLFSLLLILVITPAFAQLSDRTGLVTRFDVETSGHSYEIETVSNFELIGHEFDRNEKRLTIFITSGLENNLGEILIPKKLLGGDFTFYLNDSEVTQQIKSNDKISFVTLNFTGIGNNKLDIVGTDALVGVPEPSEIIADEPSSESGGCLIATATYGSELAPQVQQLRELRDNKLLRTESGIAFMKTFNGAYYSFSPVIADLERENPIFQEMVKISITPMISSLSILNYIELDSEAQVLAYGISLIVLNGMMYVGIPTVGIIYLRKII